MNYFGFTEIIDKSMSIDQDKIVREKMKGRY